MKKNPNRFPEGWDEARVREVLEHYENQTDDEAVAEDEAAYRRMVVERIERGRQDFEAGRVLTTEEVEQRMTRWLGATDDVS